MVEAIVRHAGAIVRQGQRGAGGGRADAPRRGRREYFARQAVGGVWAGPWQGGCGPMRCPAATSAALPCGRGCRGRAILRRSSSAGAIRGASAREVPAPPSARDIQAGPAQGPAATSAALPCDRGCRGRAISRRNNSAGKIRSGPAREVPAPPSARGVQVGPGAGPGRDKRGPPVSSRCRRRGISRRNSSEVKSRIPKPTTGAWSNYAAHKKTERKLCVWGG